MKWRPVAPALLEMGGRVDAIACPCIQRWVRESPDATPHRALIADMELRLYSNLVVWESTGSSDARDHADRLRTAVLTAWMAAKAVFAWREEEHTCGRNAAR